MTNKPDLKIEQLPVEELKEYENNTRDHGEIDIDAIKESITMFGFNDPIGIWSDDNVIVEGHGRLLAAKELGMTEVPCIRLDHMTDEERRAYAIAHNKTAELSKWNVPKLNLELAGIKSLDLSKLHLQTFNESDEYKDFEQKFVIEKTTDDCYTPKLIYEAVGGVRREEVQNQQRQVPETVLPGRRLSKRGLS